MIKSTLSAYTHTHAYTQNSTNKLHIHTYINMALQIYRVENALLKVMYAKAIDTIGVNSEGCRGQERIVEVT